MKFMNIKHVTESGETVVDPSGEFIGFIDGIFRQGFLHGCVYTLATAAAACVMIEGVRWISGKIKSKKKTKLKDFKDYKVES